MKQIRILIAIVATASLLVTGCNKNTDLDLYENDPAISFYTSFSASATDTVQYNFVLEPVTRTIDTVFIPVRIQGFAADKDRIVNVTAADSSTAKEGVHYKFGPGIVHAGNYLDSIPVYVYRTADMADSTFIVYAVLQPSADFKQGYENHLTYKIRITDRVVPPVWSYTMSATFGAFSNVKFRFMVSVLQITTFTGLLPSQAAAMGTKCKLALAEYEVVNGPLIDENGQRVVFP